MIKEEVYKTLEKWQDKDKDKAALVVFAEKGEEAGEEGFNVSCTQIGTHINMVSAALMCFLQDEKWRKIFVDMLSDIFDEIKETEE